MTGRSPIFSLGAIPAGAAAERGYFVVGVPEGKLLTLSCCSYWGGDSGEYYGMYVVPPSAAGGLVNAVPINGDEGMVMLYELAKGGNNTAGFQSMWPSMSQSGARYIAGPCTIVVTANNASPATAFQVGIYGFLEDL